MPPVRTLRLGLLVVPAAIVGASIHVNGDGGAWELLVWGLAIVTAILAFRWPSARRRRRWRASPRPRARCRTRAACIRMARWRGHVAGPVPRACWAGPTAPRPGPPRCTPTTRRRSPRPASAPRAASRARWSTGSSGPTARRARSGTGSRPRGAARVAGVRVDVTERRATERAAVERPAPPGERAAPAGRRRRDARGAARRHHRRDDRRAGLGRRRRPAARRPRPPGRPRRVHRGARRDPPRRARRDPDPPAGRRRPPRRLWLRSVPRQEPDGRRFADVIVSDVTDRAELTAELGRDAQPARPRAGRGRRLRLHARAGRGHGRAVGDVVRRARAGSGSPASEPTTPRGMASWLMAAVHPEDRVFVEQGYLQLARGAAIDRVFRLQIPDGVRHVHERARPRTDAAGRHAGRRHPDRRHRGAGGRAGAVGGARGPASASSVDRRGAVPGRARRRRLVAHRLQGPGPRAAAGPAGRAARGSRLLRRGLVQRAAPRRPGDRTSPPGARCDPTTRWRSSTASSRATGTVRWLADRAKARHTPDGAIIADSITIDVTEHRRVTDELAAARLRARADRGGGRAAAGRAARRGRRRFRGARGGGRDSVECGSPTRRWRSACSASRCRPASTSALPSSARSSRRARAAGAAPSRRLTGSCVDSRLRGLDGVVRSFAVEGAVDRRLPGATAAATVFLVVREIARDPRIAALLDAVDEPVYELELGADGIWRTTAGTGIARHPRRQGRRRARARRRRSGRRPGRCSRRTACASRPGRPRAPSSACVRRPARCGGCGSERRAAARATG